MRLSPAKEQTTVDCVFFPAQITHGYKITPFGRFELYVVRINKTILHLLLLEMQEIRENLFPVVKP